MAGMRKDMAKVLVERPRTWGGTERKGRAPRDLEDLPRFTGHIRAMRERGGYKMLNENLAPLRRFLERQVDRPWNKVHSEMCERINPRNEVQAHILSHVDQYIERRPVKVEPSRDAPCGLMRRGFQFRSLFPLKPGDLYVDPKDGIIKRARRKMG